MQQSIFETTRPQHNVRHLIAQIHSPNWRSSLGSFSSLWSMMRMTLLALFSWGWFPIFQALPPPPSSTQPVLAPHFHSYSFHPSWPDTLTSTYFWATSPHLGLSEHYRAFWKGPMVPSPLEQHHQAWCSPKHLLDHGPSLETKIWYLATIAHALLQVISCLLLRGVNMEF